MRRFIIVISSILFPLWLSAQETLEGVLKQAEANSLSLQALINSNRAEDMAARKDIWPDKPSIEMGYASNKSHSAEVKKTFAVKQELAFPSIWFQKSKYRKQLQLTAKLSEESFRQEIRLEVRKRFAEMVYYTKRMKKEAKRIENAKVMLDFFQIKMDNGDANILDFSKARINYEEYSADYRLMIADQQSVLEQIRWLCQNPDIEVQADEYELLELKDLQTILMQYQELAPELKGLAAEKELHLKEAGILKNEYLPELELGYEIEKTPSEDFRGFSLGLSIPIWGNSARYKQAKAMAKKAEFEHHNDESLMISQFKSLYYRTQSLKENHNSMQQAIDAYPAEELLEKAVKSGEISGLVYYQELEDYYKIVAKSLEAEKEYQQSLAELLKFSF